MSKDSLIQASVIASRSQRRLTGAANPVTLTERRSTRRGTCIAPRTVVPMFGARDASRRSSLTGRSIHVTALRN